MTAESSSSRHAHLQIVRGDGRATLCIWEPGLVRTTREARALAITGCAHAPSDPSPEMRAYLGMYADRFAGQLGPAAFERGRVCIGGTRREAPSLLTELAELAGDFGLSYLQPNGLVRLRLGTHDSLPVASILGLLAGGVVAHARMHDGPFRLSLRYVPDVFVATVWASPPPCTAVLRLLGFRMGRSGAWQQRYGAQTHATARALVRVLRTCVPDPGDLDTALAPCEALVPLGRPVLTRVEPSVRT
jgi:hypothetical protein